MLDRLDLLLLFRQYQRKLTLIFGDELGISGQELKDRDHGLAGLFADSLTVAFDKLEASASASAYWPAAARASAS